MFCEKIRILSCLLVAVGCLLARPGKAVSQDVIVGGEAKAVFDTPSGGQNPFAPSYSISPSAPPNLVKPGGPAKKPPTPKKSDSKTPPGKTPKKDDKKTGKPGDDAKKSDTTTRSNKPKTPANPDELKVRPDSDGKVSFQFRGQAWPDVLEWLADISDLSLDWQELPSDYLNLTTRRPYSVAEARDLINQRLLTRGYTILAQSDGLTVVKIEKLNPAQVPRVSPNDLESRMPHEFAKCSFEMNWLIATEVVKELETLKSPQGKLTPMPGANRIEAMDTVLNLREINNAITDQLSPERRKQLAREFVLTNTRADTVAEELRQFLGVNSPSRSSSSSRGMNPQQMQQMQQQMMQQMQRAAQMKKSGANSGSAITAKKIEVRVVANSRRNSIVVHAGPDKLAIVEEFIALVDVRPEGIESLDAMELRMQVFRLASLDPGRLVESLTALGGLEPRTKLTIDADNNALIVYGSLADQVLIKSVIDRLDGSGRKSEVIQLRRLPADQVAGSVMFLMGGDDKKDERRDYDWGWYPSRSSSKKKTDKFKVTANLEYNQLLVWANDIELREVYNLLEKLGEITTKDSGSRVRVIDAGDPAEMREFLKRLKKAWPSENELILPEESELPKIPPPPTAADKAKTETPKTDDKKPSLKYDDKGKTTSYGPQLRADYVSTQVDSNGRDPTTDSPPAANADKGEPAAKPVKDAAALLEQEENAKLMRRLEMLRRLQNGKVENRPSDQPQAPKKKSPIRISVNANGELVIASEDSGALMLMEQLAEQLAPPRKKFEVFHLKHASAFWVRFNLEDFFEEEDSGDDEWMSWMFGIPPRGKDKSMQLGKRRVPRFIDDLDTNTILVQGADAEQLRTIAELVKLYDVNEPVTAANSRFTKVFYIEHSRPTLIETTIKEALRDLLSSNDKALQPKQQNNGNGRGGQQEQQPRNSFTTKGKLSIGSDDVSRVMIVSCEGEQLMEIVTKMIETLDLAAKPAGAVEVVNIGGGVSMESVRQALGTFGASKNSKPQNQTRPPQQQPKQPQNNPSPTANFGNPFSGGVIIEN